LEAIEEFVIDLITRNARLDMTEIITKEVFLILPSHEALVTFIYRVKLEPMFG
jgi:hypothetical protein